MRTINYGIIIKEEDGTPVIQQSGTYPSPAYKSPHELLQSIAEFLNEEYGTHLIVKSEKKEIDFDLLVQMLDTESTVIDLDTVKARQERIARNKRELGYE